MAKLILGGILATVLLGLYIASIAISIKTAYECGVKAERVVEPPSNSTNSSKTTPRVVIVEKCSEEEKNLGNISYLLNLLGGLISATVVAVLAATQTNDLPAKDFFRAGLGNFAQGIAAYVPLAYILVWTFCGLFVVIYGLMMYDNDPSPPLTAHAKTWLGTAVAAIYAYIGITPEGTPARPAIANISIEPTSLALDSTHSSEKLTATATDAQSNSIPSLPSDRFVWKSSDTAVATVDKTGLVERVAPGTCNITATANAITSNNCAVTCS